MASEAVVPVLDSPLPATDCLPLKIALLGFGTVGHAVAAVLQKQRFENLELTHVFNRKVACKRADWVPLSVVWTESIDEVLNSHCDVVVEVLGGLEPTRTWVRAALDRGKSVVTANKQLVARHGPELLEVAHRNRCQLLFGASVAGVVPVIAGLGQGLAGDRIEAVCGILNGTCNYVLTQMEQGFSFDAALRTAQELGYAEADPSDDVHGYDARAKLLILARAALGIELPLDEIGCSTISQLRTVDFEYARELGCTIRQVARAEFRNAETFASVEPTLVPRSSHLARAEGCENVLIATGRFGGDTVFAGAGAGGDATAVAVISDLLSLAEGHRNRKHPQRFICTSAGDIAAAYFLRFIVRDRPGIVAGISGVLAAYGINVDSVLQRSGYDRRELPFVITVEPCSRAQLFAALEQIGRFDFLVEPPLRLGVLEVRNHARATT